MTWLGSIFVVMMTLTAGVAVTTSKSALVPSTLFSWYLGALVVFAAVYSGQLPLNESLLLFLLVLQVLVAVTGKLALPTVDTRILRGGGYAESDVGGRWWYFLTIVCALGFFSQMFSGFARFGLSGGLEDFLSLGNAYSVERYRYGQGTGGSIIARWATFLVYPLSILGGLRGEFSSSSRRRVLALLPLLLSLGLSLLDSTRAGFLLASVAWVSGYCAARVLHTQSTPDIVSSGLIARSILGSGIATVVFTGIYTLRWGIAAAERQGSQLEKLASALIGGLGRLSAIWDHVNIWPHDWGAVSFVGPASLIGLSSRTQGTYAEFIDTRGGISGNIFTGFRGLLIDFGVMGTLILVPVALWALDRVFWRVKAGDQRQVGVLAVAYFWILFSLPFVSIFNFNSVFFGSAISIAWIWKAGGGRSDFRLISQRVQARSFRPSKQ